jgi:enamine deaminase RidA (YjgF/YER057c/UK114 family)
MSGTNEVLHPEGWAPAKGYANGVKATGTMIFVGGQIGWTAEQTFETDDFVGQCEQALKNIRAVLEEGGAGPEHLVRLTWFVTDKQEYLAALRELGGVYRAVMGRNFPAMTMVEVKALVEDRAKVEIEATAVL